MLALEGLNQAISLHMNADVSTPHWVIARAKLLADDLIYMIPLAMAIMWTRGHSAERNPALEACAIALVALGLNQLIALVWFHPRPAQLGVGHTFIEHAQDSSFPSDHVTVLLAVGLSMVCHDARSVLGWLALVGVISVAWARIFLGVHFPLDMLGAVGVVGLTWLGITPLWTRIGGRITSWAERLYRVVLSWPIDKGWILS